jgi:Protein of unknown function (DUF2934)
MAKRSSDENAPAKPKVTRARRSKAPLAPIDTAADAALTAPAKPVPTADDIRLRAYQLYLERASGGQGSEFDDWLRAEAELQNR